MLSIFKGQLNLQTTAYRAFVVPTEVLDRIRYATPAEAASAFDLHVRSQLGLMSFQHPEKIADALRLCSGVELWNAVALHLGATEQTKTKRAKEIKRTLAAIVDRRNKIAHEGDMQPSTPRTPWPIKQDDLFSVSSFLQTIVRAIDAVCC